MDTPVRRLAAPLATGVAILVALPGTVSAECNGPACGEVGPIDGAQGTVLIAILVVFGTVMAIAEVRGTRRRP